MKMMMMMMSFWLIVPLLLIGGVALALGWRLLFNQKESAHQPTPLEIIEARHASGEINREEYDQMLRDLDG
jgi:uncharacterized membrane protein